MPNLHNTYPCGLDGKISTCNEGELGSVPGSKRSPGEGNGNPLQYSCLENPIDMEPGSLQVQGVERIGHDLATKQEKA